VGVDLCFELHVDHGYQQAPSPDMILTADSVRVRDGFESTGITSRPATKWCILEGVIMVYTTVLYG
jgi:hypothetical protein